MKHWKIWTAFIAVFVSGILVGVTGLGLVIQHRLTPPKDTKQFKSMIRERVLKELQEEVRPDVAALPAITRILDETFNKLESIRKETRPRVKGTFMEGVERVKKHLTPEQSQRLDVMVEKRKKRRFSLFRLPPPPPPM